MRRAPGANSERSAKRRSAVCLTGLPRDAYRRPKVGGLPGGRPGLPPCTRPPRMATRDGALPLFRPDRAVVRAVLPAESPPSSSGAPLLSPGGSSEGGPDNPDPMEDTMTAQRRWPGRLAIAALGATALLGFLV